MRRILNTIMRTVISYETIGKLGRLPAKILGLIFAQLSPIQQFKLNEDLVLRAIFNQANDYNIIVRPKHKEDIMVYLLYALSDIYDKLDINEIPKCYRHWISSISKKKNIYINILHILYNMFNYDQVSEAIFYYEYAEKSLDEYDTDVLYSRLGDVLYPILIKENKLVGEYFIVQSIYKLMLNYAFFCKPYIFTKYFADKDSCDNIYHIIIGEVTNYIKKLSTERYLCIIAKEKYIGIQKANHIYKPYIVHESIVIDIYQGVNEIIPVLERVFSEPRLKRYRAGWIENISKNKSVYSIHFLDAISKSPILCEYINTIPIKQSNLAEEVNIDQQ